MEHDVKDECRQTAAAAVPVFAGHNAHHDRHPTHKVDAKNRAAHARVSSRRTRTMPAMPAARHLLVAALAAWLPRHGSCGLFDDEEPVATTCPDWCGDTHCTNHECAACTICVPAGGIMPKDLNGVVPMRLPPPPPPPKDQNGVVPMRLPPPPPPSGCLQWCSQWTCAQDGCLECGPSIGCFSPPPPPSPPSPPVCSARWLVRDRSGSFPYLVI